MPLLSRPRTRPSESIWWRRVSVEQAKEQLVLVSPDASTCLPPPSISLGRGVHCPDLRAAQRRRAAQSSSASSSP